MLGLVPIVRVNVIGKRCENLTDIGLHVSHLIVLRLSACRGESARAIGYMTISDS
jgi:hypothetical protein